MALEKYKEKRRFKITPEPPPRVERSKGGPIFVIQEHHATRLHYDFRLEADGVLKSWAVTKEPTLDPRVKRLAVQVEDHPLAYASFHGDIPEGEYGAGHVEIWDSGRYENLLEEKPEKKSVAEAIEEGHVEIELHGSKLEGKFALIRMKGEEGKNWLLIKMKDKKARGGSAAGDGSARKGSTAKKESADGKSDPKNDRKVAGAGKGTGRGTRGGTARGRVKAPKEIELTHPDKVMFPDAGFTKEDLFRFYERIADHLLPHLAGRPMTLERLPDGFSSPKAPHFWQKDTPEHYPEWIPRIELESEQGEPVHYVLVNDRETLLYLVNQGTVTFHPWLSRVDDLDRPDFILFDLDPGPRTFADAIIVARQVHDVLRDEGIEAYVKTSGKSGIHVLTPWTKRGGYNEGREWAMEIAERVVAELPAIATVERSKAKRSGRLYLDVMQNARGHHVVPPYVARATPGATVSTPLRWSELTDALTPAKFDLRSIFRRLSRLKDDPIAPLTKKWGGRA